MDHRAQVSFEYLLLVAISALLVLFAAVLALQFGGLADTAKLKLWDARDSLLKSTVSS
ncbi:MAG: hypothetical protein HY917_00005 [Candidatus Diapherotrites archaeon]|nr:hypothetical protein [Candidatus Diapherotrites archaeon]